MLKRTPDIVIPGEADMRAKPLAEAATAAALVDRLGDGNLIFVAVDEQRAAAITAIAAAFAPNATVVHLPSSDALPGEDAPSSPANAGARVAALRRLRLAATTSPVPPPLLLVTSAEATIAMYATPESFDDALPSIGVGDALDLDGFTAIAEDLGYVVDDRVDEPGEVAIRGNVVDLFPADHAGPIRIDVSDGTVVGIRSYDPVTQLGTGELERIEIGRAAEPPVAKGVAITAHVPDASVSIDPGVLERRMRILAIAMDGANERKAKRQLIDAQAWAKAAKVGAPLPEAGDAPPPRFVEQRDPARAFARFAKSVLADGRLLVTGSPRDLRFLAHRTKLSAKPVADLRDARAADAGELTMLAAPVERGFVSDGLVVVAAADLLGSRASLGDVAHGQQNVAFATDGALHPGDVVVHEDFGIGQVIGLDTSPAGDGDMIVLEYAKGGRRLVPVAEADRIWRYGAEADAVTLDTLDGASWQKRRGAIDAAIAESATALAEIAAERSARETPPVIADTAAYERFAAGFGYSETPDQAKAIAAVRNDLASGRPMDRLVVGDVGYGKTEVALRAAAIVALAGRQVAIVAPTTVLVRQHLDSFTRRFDGTDCAVAALSRLSSAAERKRVKAGLADGSISVVVGTAAVAAKGIGYHDLALVVIDEEQRFGAADKAKLHALGAGHVLTLSATPIPRTLQSALVGLQSISTIATPPARRQPIRTTIAEFDDDMVRKALQRERSRGGQSFVVVPRIEDIAPLAEKIARLVPELGLVTAHGKLPAEELDEAMVGFAAGDGDILLATNIIEAGLDVPRANTMIVHRADRFGLSQLHQLRGRVGRGGRRGQILLLTAAGAEIAEGTLKRLRTLQAFDRLGAGFAISARDLDLRGAGDLLGEAQAGHMKLIGVELYQFLLGRALAAARGEEADRWVPELHLGSEGRLPAAWIPEAEVRLSLYGRLARLEGLNAIDDFQHELEDRFGTMPGDAVALLDLARIKALAGAAGIARVDAGPAAIAFTPRRAKDDVPTGFEAKDGRWIVRDAIVDESERLDRVRELLDF